MTYLLQLLQVHLLCCDFTLCVDPLTKAAPREWPSRSTVDKDADRVPALSIAHSPHASNDVGEEEVAIESVNGSAQPASQY